MTTFLWSNLIKNSTSRVRPIGYETWFFGMGLAVLSHGVLVALVFYSHILGSKSPEVARSYIFTSLVSLDRRLEKPWLPPNTPSKEPVQSDNQAKSTLPMGDNEMNLNTATLIQDGKRRRRERATKIARNTGAPYDESDEESMAPAMISMAVAKSQLLTDPEIDRRYRFAIPPELNRAGDKQPFRGSFFSNISQPHPKIEE